MSRGRREVDTGLLAPLRNPPKDRRTVALPHIDPRTFHVRCSRRVHWIADDRPVTTEKRTVEGLREGQGSPGNAASSRDSPRPDRDCPGESLMIHRAVPSRACTSLEVQRKRDGVQSSAILPSPTCSVSVAHSGFNIGRSRVEGISKYS